MGMDSFILKILGFISNILKINEVIKVILSNSLVC